MKDVLDRTMQDPGVRKTGKNIEKLDPNHYQLPESGILFYSLISRSGKSYDCV